MRRDNSTFTEEKFDSFFRLEIIQNTMIQRRSQSCVNLLTQLSNVSNSRKDVHRMSILTSTSSTINLASPLTQLLRNRNRLDISQSIRNYTANATDTVRSGNTPPTAKSESQAAQSVQGTTPDNLEQQNRSKVTSDVEAKDREIIELKVCIQELDVSV